MTRLERFFSKTERDGECLVWTGTVNSQGYPCFAINGRSQLAHRWAYGQYFSLDSGQQVHHTCGNRRCVEIDHLSALTHEDHVREHHPEGAPCSLGHPRKQKRDGRWTCPTCNRYYRQQHKRRREELINAILNSSAH